MDARFFRAAALAAAVAFSGGATYKTPNFIVETQSPEMAKRLGEAAEQYRHQMAVEWLGKELPDWSQPCPMTVQVGPNLGAGGATTFIFDHGEVFGWRMSIQGSAERLLDSVLPHEITHMIFASHFRQPLPRWADEGGATSVEHPSELARHRRMLIQFLKTNRGIPFNRMLAMTEYPPDVMPLYAQGHSLAEFLIQQGGRRKYVDFLGDGLKYGQWPEAIRAHYGAPSAGALQNAWLAWVRQGSPALASPGQQSEVITVAATDREPRPKPNLIYHARGQRDAASGQRTPIGTESDMSNRGPTGSARELPTDGWHAAGQPPAAAAVAEAVSPEPRRTQAAHPQPVEKARQIILEWGRR